MNKNKLTEQIQNDIIDVMLLHMKRIWVLMV